MKKNVTALVQHSVYSCHNLGRFFRITALSSIAIRPVLLIPPPCTSKKSAPTYEHNIRNVVLVHGAAFPVLPYFSQGVASKIEAVQEGQGYGHSSKDVKFLLRIFASIGSPKSGHFDPSFDSILNRQGGKYCRILISSLTKY